jgi:hypothetical protein
VPPGLDGKPLSLIIYPFGWVILVIHYLAFCLFFVWDKSATRSAEAHLREAPIQERAQEGKDEPIVPDGHIRAVHAL